MSYDIPTSNSLRQTNPCSLSQDLFRLWLHDELLTQVETVDFDTPSFKIRTLGEPISVPLPFCKVPIDNWEKLTSYPTYYHLFFFNLIFSSISDMKSPHFLRRFKSFSTKINGIYSVITMIITTNHRESFYYEH